MVADHLLAFCWPLSCLGAQVSMSLDKYLFHWVFFSEWRCQLAASRKGGSRFQGCLVTSLPYFLHLASPANLNLLGTWSPASTSICQIVANFYGVEFWRMNLSSEQEIKRLSELRSCPLKTWNKEVVQLTTIGTLRSENDDGSENVVEKVNSRSFNLHRD